MLEQRILNEIKILEDMILMKEMHDLGMIDDSSYRAYISEAVNTRKEEIKNVDQTQQGTV